MKKINNEDGMNAAILLLRKGHLANSVEMSKSVALLQQEFLMKKFKTYNT
jgi:hypothetical protein